MIRTRKNLCKWSAISVLLLCLFAFSSCHHDHEDPHTKASEAKRTVLVYIVAENSLGQHAAEDIQEMLIGIGNIPDSVNLMVYVDDQSEPRIYNITNKTTSTTYRQLEPEYTFPKEVISTDPTTLDFVMKYMKEKHRAKNYGVVFWSHGSGWMPSSYEVHPLMAESKQRKSFGIDNGANWFSNNGEEMEIADMANVMEKYNKNSEIEFILFDACYMQSIEAAYTLRKSAKYIIGSPTEIPGAGAPYHEIMRHMFAETFEPKNLIDAYCNFYEINRRYGILLSAIKTDALEDFANYMSSIAVPEALVNMKYNHVQNYFSYDKYAEFAVYCDMYDFLSIMKNSLDDESFKRWKVEYDKAVPYAHDATYWFSGIESVLYKLDKEQYGGTTMFVPLKKYKTNWPKVYNAYFENEWSKIMGYEY